MSARDIIRREYGSSPNFMTPTPLRYFMVRTSQKGFAVAVELSTGEGFHGGTIYGVSVVRAYPWGTRRMFNFSTCFTNREDANQHIYTMTEKLGRKARA